MLRAGLQRPVNNQILIFCAVKEYCKSPIEGITFLTIDKEDMVAARENLKPQYELDVTILGTRSCHHFVPTSQYTIEGKQLSINKTVFITHSFWTYQHYKMRLLSHLNAMTTLLAALMSSDDWHWLRWWIRKTKASHASFSIHMGHPDNFTGLVVYDSGHVPLNKVIVKIQTPTIGRTYFITEAENNKTQNYFERTSV